MSKTAKKPGSPLEEGKATFLDGDYVLARRQLAAVKEDSNVPEGDRQMADDLIRATRIDRGTLMVGLACIGLVLLIVVITALKQP